MFWWRRSVLGINHHVVHEIHHLDDAAFRALFSKSPVKRIGRDRFLRNVAYAIGNSRDVALLPVAEKLSAEPDAVLADAGRWAVLRLRHLKG